jgi:hypothetical protein
MKMFAEQKPENSALAFNYWLLKLLAGLHSFANGSLYQRLSR